MSYGVLILPRKAQLESCRESRDTSCTGDSVTWSTEIHLDLLCDDVTSLEPASTRLRYIEHPFSKRSLHAQL